MSFCLRKLHLAAVAAFCVICMPGAQGQENATGVGVVTGFMGGITGLGTHPGGGFAFASPTSEHLVPVLEFTYSSLGSTGFRDDLRGSVLQRSRIYDLSAGVHIRFPNNTHFVPYLALGLGWLRSAADVAVAQGTSQTYAHQSTDYLAPEAGAGTSYFFTNHWGVRPEIKGYLAGRRFVRISVGLFYQFP